MHRSLHFQNVFKWDQGRFFFVYGQKGSKGIDMVESGMHAFLSKKVLLFLWIVAKHAIRAMVLY